MKTRNHIMFQYTVTTAVIIITVSVLLGWMIVDQVERHLLNMHAKQYRTLVERYEEMPSVISFFESSGARSVLPSDVERLFFELLAYKQISRITFWNKKGEILWTGGIKRCPDR